MAGGRWAEVKRTCGVAKTAVLTKGSQKLQVSAIQRHMHIMHQFASKDALDETPREVDTQGVETIINPRLGQLAVLVAAVGFGSSPVFASRAFDAGISPIAASFIRVFVLLVVLSPWAGAARRWRRESLIVAAGGAISMLGFTGFFIALDRAPVAAATVVYYTYPVVVLGLSTVVWRRRLQRWEALACIGVLGGVTLAVGPIAMSGAMLIALAPAFLAPIGWAIYLLVLSGPAAAMPTLPKVFAGSVGGVAALLPVVIWDTGIHLMPATSDAATSMAMLTGCTLAIPAVLVTWGSARSGERATAMIGSLEFVVAIALGWLLLGDQLTTTQLCGVLLVLASAGSATRRAATDPNRHAVVVKASQAATRSVSS